MQPSDIVIFSDNNLSREKQQKWDDYSRYIFRGSDLLNNNVPEKIESMLAMYEYGDGSFRQKCLNFINQGKFMEDYEDDVPWYGNLLRYFPVYHDLNIKQLRGYFTWRTQIRKGEFTKTCPSFAYIYIYELLNGIGADSDLDAVVKLMTFRKHYVEAGFGDNAMKANLRQWLFDFAVIHRFPRDATMQFAKTSTRDRGHSLAILRSPDLYADEEVFNALSRFAESNTAKSPVLSKDKSRGMRLFVNIWRHIAAGPAVPPAKPAEPPAEPTEPPAEPASATGMTDSPEAAQPDVFSVCFGEKKIRPWHPLGNAIYVQKEEIKDLDFELDGCRRFFCLDGEWQEETYDWLSGSRYAFMALMHSADLRLRRMLKTGHYLHNKGGDDWAMPYIDNALAEIREEEAEAARPKISIDLSGLDKIREDAGVTRDSLLTESEMDLDETFKPAADTDPYSDGTQNPDEGLYDSGGELLNLGSEQQDPDSDLQELDSEQQDPDSDLQELGLDELQITILKELLAGRSTKNLIDKNRLMPSVVADSINEALIDEIGDSVIECTDDELTLVDDYTDDIIALTGGCANE